MKRILKLKKIKNSKRPRKYINKKRMPHGMLLCKKRFFQIDSPRNTNEYLINVNSAPFYYNETDDEDSINIIPNSFIKISNDTNSELNLFIHGESDSTIEKTIKKEEEQRKKIERLFRWRKYLDKFVTEKIFQYEEKILGFKTEIFLFIFNSLNSEFKTKKFIYK